MQGLAAGRCIDTVLAWAENANFHVSQGVVCMENAARHEQKKMAEDSREKR
jgi:hypothetical protein